MNHNLVKYQYNLISLVNSKKSFVIHDFFYVSDIFKGAHHSKTSKILFPLSTNEFGIDYKYLVDTDTGRMTRKYNLSSKILSKAKNNLTFIDEASVRLLEINKSELPKIQFTHVMPYKNILVNLFADVDIENEKSGLSIEEINTNYNLKFSNKGYILYRSKVKTFS